MGAPHIRPATREDQPAVKALIFAILDEYSLEPAPQSTDKDLDDLIGFYEGGLFDVLETDAGDLIGTVGLVPINNGACELRKMYLKTNHRGRGYGKRLLKHAIGRATDLGFVRIELQTARVLEEAIALYEKFGFSVLESVALERRCDHALALDLKS